MTGPIPTSTSISPERYRQGKDTQLERGIAEVLKLFEKRAPFRPVPEDDPRQAETAGEGAHTDPRGE